MLTAFLFGFVFVSRSQTPPTDDPLKRLSFLEGEWESKETTKGADGKEIPFTLKGKNTWILDSKYLQIDEAFEVTGEGKFANHILMTFDKGLKKYRAWWFTSRGSQPLTFTADWMEKDFVLSDERGRLRITYHPLEAGHYKADVAVKRGEEWVTQTTAEYKRVGS